MAFEGRLGVVNRKSEIAERAGEWSGGVVSVLRTGESRLWAVEEQSSCSFFELRVSKRGNLDFKHNVREGI